MRFKSEKEAQEYLAKLKEKYLAPVVKEFIEYVKESNGKAL